MYDLNMHIHWQIAGPYDDVSRYFAIEDLMRLDAASEGSDSRDRDLICTLVFGA